MSEDASPKSLSLTLSPTAKLSPLVPTSFDEVARLAKLVAMAGMFQPTYLRKDEKPDPDKVLAQATMAILQGMDLGIPPMQAVQNIAVINGRCCVWGALVPALLWSNGFKLREWTEGEGDDHTAHCEITRPDGSKVERTFSVKQAKKAGLWDERPTVKRKYGDKWEDKANDSPWFKYSYRMLQMRARGFCANDGAADVMKGMMLREEAEDIRVVHDVFDAVASDGEGLITLEQAAELQELCMEVQRDEQRFLRFLSTAIGRPLSVWGDIPANQFDRAKMTLEAKRTA